MGIKGIPVDFKQTAKNFCMFLESAQIDIIVVVVALFYVLFLLF